MGDSNEVHHSYLGLTNDVSEIVKVAMDVKYYGMPLGSLNHVGFQF